MANWHVYVQSGSIAAGTQLDFTYNGGPGDTVSPKDAFSVEFPNADRVGGTVVANDGNTATIEIDSKQYVIRPANNSDNPLRSSAEAKQYIVVKAN